MPDASPGESSRATSDAPTQAAAPLDTVPDSRPDPSHITDRSELAAALTRLREGAGLSVRELARRTGVPPGTVGGYLSGRHLPGPAQQATFACLLRACGIDDFDELAGWRAAIRRIRLAPGPRGADVRPPYPGLASFQPDDAAFFFGRDDATAAVLGMIDRARAADHGGLVTVVGASGSGKSSVLRAGVAPAAQRAGVATMLFSPGEQPVAALASAIGEHLGLASGTIRALAGDGGALAGCLERAGRVLLIVDQAEELFTVCREAADRREFLRLLHRVVAVTDPQGRRLAVAVIGLRGDFYAAAAAEPTLFPALRDAQVLMGSMTRDELVQAITGPASAVGIHVEDGLLQMLLDDLAPHDAPGVAHDRGALPLLAHALRETWQVARRGRMTIADYLSTGGIGGAVERTAESVWSGLTEPERELARRMLLRLVFVDEEAAVTRRRVRAAELLGLQVAQPPRPDGPAPTGQREPSDSVVVAGLIDRFVRARLLTARRDTIEISHEALLVAWSRLHDWVDADRSGLRVHRQLAEAAQAWADGGQDPSYLLRGNRLVAIAEWLDAGRAILNRQERAFLDASLTERAAAERGERRRRRRLRQALAAVAVLAVVAAALAVFGFRATRAADERAVEAATARDQAQSRELAIAADRLRDTDPALAAQLALIAYRTSPTVDGRSALLDSTAAPSPTRIAAQDGPTFVAWDGGAAVLAVTGAQRGSVSLWSMRDPGAATKLSNLPSASPAGQPFSVAVDPRGHQLATGNENGLIQRWTIDDPTRPVTVAGPGRAFPSGVLGLAFSPDGDVLAAGGAGGAIQRWDVTDPQRAQRLTSLPASAVVGAVAYSPDGSMLWAGGGDGVLRGWPIAPRPAAPADRITADPVTLHAGTAQINTIAVSPDGSLVVAGDKAGQVAVWRRGVAGRWERQEEHLDGLTGWVSAAAFSPDGSLLAIGTTGNQVLVVSTARWSTVMTALHPGPVTSLTFDGSADLVTAATDGYVRVWPVPGPVIGPVATQVFGLGLTAGHHLFVAPGSGANDLLPYDTSEPDRPVAGTIARISGGAGDITLDGALAIAPDGRLAAEGARDGRVQLWGLADPEHPAAIGLPLKISDGLVEQLAFSPDGRTLAVGADDERVRLWDVSNPRSPHELSSTGVTGSLVYAVAFSPSGSVLAGATTAGTVMLWNVADLHHPVRLAVLSGMNGYALATVFSPDGSVLAAAGADRTVYRWDVTDPAHPRALGEPLAGPANNIDMIGYTADGTRLAAVTSDGVVWIWDTSDRADPTLWARLHAGSGILYSLAISPDGTRLAAAGSAQQVWSWALDAATAERRICRTAGAGITRSEWAIYVQGQPYRPPCG